MDVNHDVSGHDYVMICDIAWSNVTVNLNKYLPVCAWRHNSENNNRCYFQLNVKINLIELLTEPYSYIKLTATAH